MLSYTVEVICVQVAAGLIFDAEMNMFVYWSGAKQTSWLRPLLSAPAWNQSRGGLTQVGPQGRLHYRPTKTLNEASLGLKPEGCEQSQHPAHTLRCSLGFCSHTHPQDGPSREAE